MAITMRPRNSRIDYSKIHTRTTSDQQFDAYADISPVRIWLQQDPYSYDFYYREPTRLINKEGFYLIALEGYGKLQTLYFKSNVEATPSELATALSI